MMRAVISQKHLGWSCRHMTIKVKVMSLLSVQVMGQQQAHCWESGGEVTSVSGCDRPAADSWLGHVHVRSLLPKQLVDQ